MKSVDDYEVMIESRLALRRRLVRLLLLPIGLMIFGVSCLATGSIGSEVRRVGALAGILALGTLIFLLSNIHHMSKELKVLRRIRDGGA